jgi:hypothetical protein
MHVWLLWFKCSSLWRWSINNYHDYNSLCPKTLLIILTYFFIQIYGPSFILLAEPGAGTTKMLRHYLYPLGQKRTCEQMVIVKQGQGSVQLYKGSDRPCLWWVCRAEGDSLIPLSGNWVHESLQMHKAAWVNSTKNRKIQKSRDITVHVLKWHGCLVPLNTSFCTHSHMYPLSSYYCYIKDLRAYQNHLECLLKPKLVVCTPRVSNSEFGDRAWEFAFLIVPWRD